MCCYSVTIKVPKEDLRANILLKSPRFTLTKEDVYTACKSLHERDLHKITYGGEWEEAASVLWKLSDKVLIRPDQDEVETEAYSIKKVPNYVAIA